MIKPELNFDNSYARLPAQFHSKQEPTPVAQPELIRINPALAVMLGLDSEWLASPTGVAWLAGNSHLNGTEPLAAVYAGHQFGSFNPQLGDGRAVLLGEIVNKVGQRYDLQLKGSGPTPYSRGGDGRSPLGPVLREYLVSEAMAALGIPGTRALAAVATGEAVMREEVLPGAVLTRVASSHIRIGTFQYFSSRGDTNSLQLLADHVIDRHYPVAGQSEQPTLALLQAVIERQAALVAHWQLVGFIHGVMNTDNMLLCGETIDYGPCAFMDEYEADKVFSSIDRGGRYAYSNQPGIAHWNLAQLAQSLLPLLDSDTDAALAAAQAAIDSFPGIYSELYQRGMLAKLGLNSSHDGDIQLIEDLLAVMAEQKTDFTLAFRHLADLANPDLSASKAIPFEFTEGFDSWLTRWRQRLAQEAQTAAERQYAMYSVNPAYIPRNHQVEEAIRAATYEQDLTPFHRLMDVLQTPFDYSADNASYVIPPKPEQAVQQTFCGT